MQSGRLRHRITIQEPVESSDGMGGVTTTWNTFATIWANIRPLRGREYIAAQQTQSGITHKIEIRYLENLTPKKRVKWNSRYFDIESVLDVFERNKQMDLMCVETFPVKDG